MRAACIQTDYSMEMVSLPMPEVLPGGALLRGLLCGVCGSDADKLNHRKALPGRVLGHELVGRIESFGDDIHQEKIEEPSPSGRGCREATGEGKPIQNWHIGDRIVVAHHVPCRTCHYCVHNSQSMCRHFKETDLSPGGFSEYIAITEEHLGYTAFKVPEGITDAEASCVEPLACVIRAVNRSMIGDSVENIRENERESNPENNKPENNKNEEEHRLLLKSIEDHQSVLIVGLGYIGLLAAQVYQQRGSLVYGVDLKRERLELAKRHGFVTEAIHPQQDVVRFSQLMDALPVGKVDRVFLTVMNSHTLEFAFQHVRDGGTIVSFTGSGENNAVAIDPNQLYFREINWISSYSPSLRDLQQSAQMIFNQRIHLQPLLTATYPLSDIQEAFERYQSGKNLKSLVRLGLG